MGRLRKRPAFRILLISLLLIAAPVAWRTVSETWCWDNCQDDFDNLATNVNYNVSSSGRETDSYFHQVPMHPFAPNEPKYLIILTYQRCGSSAVGQFFNSNPNIFYIFEPLDSLFSSLYGTRQGWNIPSDLISYANGTERKISAMEVEAIWNFLRDLLSCDLNALPTETLVLRYFFTLFSDFLASQNYIRCLQKKKINYDKCESFTQSYCGSRFGEKSERVLERCNRLLRNRSLPGEKISTQVRRRFTSHRQCMNELRLDVKNSCLPLLDKACSSRRIRVAKVVRAPMESMEPLLRTIPNFRVLHLIRDPRAVALSRKEFDPSARGIYAANANDSMVNEATVYCRNVVRDIRVRQELEKIHPGKIYSVIHDEVFSNSVEAMRNVYQFIGETVHNSTWAWLKSRRSLSRRLFRWKEMLSFQMSRDIFRNCRELFRLVRSKKWTL